ncbi:MAG: alpha/beta hydrolase [Reinekea sp.]|jgi:acetyl esterase
MKMKRIFDPAVEAQSSMLPHLDISDPTEARAALEAVSAAMAEQGFQRPVDDRVEEIERTIPGPAGAPEIPIRIYMPKQRTEAGPGFVNFHMGGFIFGDLEGEHLRCLTLAAEAGAVAIGVDYRLAPEHPFPAGVEDCYAALQWVAEHAAELKIDPAKIAIGGGSAGGGLTAAVALMARDRNGPELAFQMLLYPVIDDRCKTLSMIHGTDLAVWDYQNSLDMWDQYLGKARDVVSAYAAPARAEDLSALPPAYVITCEHDVLRDEGIFYAMRLMAAGVPVEMHNYPGTVHAFDLLTVTDVATRALGDQVAAFKRIMSA